MKELIAEEGITPFIFAKFETDQTREQHAAFVRRPCFYVIPTLIQGSFRRLVCLIVQGGWASTGTSKEVSKATVNEPFSRCMMIDDHYFV